MGALLRILDGPQAGLSCELRRGQRAVLGRGIESDLQILDGWASRDHCAVTCTRRGITLEDLRSKNGTYVGGQRVETCSLGDGALIQIGTTNIEVALAPAGRAIAVAVPAPRLPIRGVVITALAGLALAAAVYAGLHLFQKRTRTISLTSEPDGASVFIDGELRGATPLKNVELAIGEHHLKLQREDYLEHDGTFAVRADRNRPIRVELQDVRAVVSFASSPAGASVWLDGKFHGTTPVNDAKIEPGEHTLKIEKKDYTVHKATIELGAGRNPPVHVELKLVERGSLVVNSKPSGARVYLDSEDEGRTPRRFRNLDPGVYRLRLSMPNYKTWPGTGAREVVVEPGRTTTVDAELEAEKIGFHIAKLRKDPNNVSYHCELAHLYLLAHKVDRFLKSLGRAIEISTVLGTDTSRPEPYAARLASLVDKIYRNDHFDYARGDPAFVEKVRAGIDGLFVELAGKHPDSAALLQFIRTRYARARRQDRMLAVYLKLAEVRPTNATYLSYALAAIRRSGDYAKAQEILTRAAENAPNDYRRQLLLGHVYLLMKKRGTPGAREKAIQALNAALAQCKDEAEKRKIRYLLGQVDR